MYAVVHTHGSSVECVIGCPDLKAALAKALEVATRSGFFNPETVEGLTQADAIDNGRHELERDNFVRGEVPRENQVVWVKRVFMAS